jgi:hypothetical protein
MGAKIRKTVELLYTSIEVNSADIERRLCEAGINPTEARALVFSAAKYYEALNKLADK